MLHLCSSYVPETLVQVEKVKKATPTKKQKVEKPEGKAKKPKKKVRNHGLR
jgi:hypothetical protein